MAPSTRIQACESRRLLRLFEKRIFFRGISLPSTDITRIRIKHSLKRNFLKKRSPETKGQFRRTLFWCGRMKMKTLETNLQQNKNVSLPLFFSTSVEYLRFHGTYLVMKLLLSPT